MSLNVLHISDTHLKPFKELPSADLLIHSGDALNYGTMEDLIRFRTQLEAIKHNYELIVFVPGNHDRIFEDSYFIAEQFLKETIPNLQVLDNRPYMFKGYKLYGSPDQPYFCNWAFNVKNPHGLYDIYSMIPDDTDILITHCPPKGILDEVYKESVGSIELKAHLHRLKQLKLHCFGHIHYSTGMKGLDKVIFSNGAVCNEDYECVNGGNYIGLP